MEFVVVVAGLIIFNFAGSLAAIQQDRWCEAWLDRLHRSLGAKFTPWLLFAVSVFVPAAIILLIDRFVAGWFHGLVWLAFNLLVLLYAFGRGNLDDQLNSYLAHLERDDLQAAYHDAAAFIARSPHIRGIDPTKAPVVVRTLCPFHLRWRIG